MCNNCPTLGKFIGRFFGGCGQAGCGCGERIHSELKCHREYYKIEFIPQPPITRTITRMVPVCEEVQIPCPPKAVRVPVPCPEPCPEPCPCGEPVNPGTGV